ncbi:MAG TPA: chemotaxis protein CheB [Kofleriaceae bacterium]|nr:chemotaxis protein CheB [Kofleriaceae bacterium]
MAGLPTTVRRDLVVMGASAGGVDALTTILRGLPRELGASVVVVQHRPANALPHLIELLRRETRLPISWVEQGGPHEHDHVYLAPPDLHVTFSDGHFNLTASAKENYARPSINRLFRSAAAHYGSRTLGVLLTGMLDDGVAGLVAISRVGGGTIVQDPDTALAPELPRNGLSAVPTSRVVPLDRIARSIVDASRESAPSLPIPEDVRLESEADKHASLPEDLDRFAERATVTCDECGGPLWRLPGPGPLRFRCYLGHAMSATDRLERYHGEAEAAMWSAVRALNERGATFESLGVEARQHGDPAAALEFEQNARSAFEQATLAYDFVTRLMSRR